MTSPGGYWPRPWTCEDGGPRRLGAPQGQRGLAIAPGERLELTAVRDAGATGMLIRREPGELFALRHELPGRPQGPPVRSWIERLDPLTLATLDASPRLPGGPFWPGGMAAHACGDLHLVLGHWAHRLSPALEVLASHRLPVERPHNSFVVLDGGELVMKDCDAPAGLAPSTLSVLDPLTLLPVAPPLALPEPSIARLSSDGEHVIAVGTTQVFRITLDRSAGQLVLDEGWRPRYGPAPGRSYGWDPVLSDDHVFWMDNGRNATDATMLGSAATPAPVRLWWARHDDDAARSVEVSGLPYGTQSNPPGWDPVGRVVVGYDAGNAVLAAWRMTGEELEPLWRRDGLRARRASDPVSGHARAGRPGLAGPPAPAAPAPRGPAAARRAGPRAGGPPCGRARRPRRPPRRPRPRHGHGARDLRRAVRDAGVPVPGAGLRARRLLPVAHDRRAGAGALTGLSPRAGPSPPSRRRARSPR